MYMLSASCNVILHIDTLDYTGHYFYFYNVCISTLHAQYGFNWDTLQVYCAKLHSI